MNNLKKIKYNIIFILIISLIVFGCNKVSALEISFSDIKTYNAVINNISQYISGSDANSKKITIDDNNLQSITTIDISNNNLTNLNGLQSFTYLNDLDVGNNNLDNNSMNVIRTLSNLKKLNIRGNRIDALGDISNLSQLEYLDISKNKFVESSLSSLSSLTNLNYLDASHNYLNDISGLSNLVNLKTLKLYDNNIKNYAGLSGLTNLEYLSLGYNNETGKSSDISNIESISNLVNLKYLDFSNNRDPHIVGQLVNLTNLETLILDNNYIYKIGSLANLSNLKVLNLYNNRINNSTTEGLPVIGNLVNLEEINLSHNTLTDGGTLDISTLCTINKLKKIAIYNSDITENECLSNLISLSRNHQIELDYEYLTDTSNVVHEDNGIQYVLYDDFGARADGIYDDFIAIRNTHEYANKYGYEVRATPGKTYHIYKYYDDAVKINTNVDWEGANFVIHDEDIEDKPGRFKNIFIFKNVPDEDVLTLNNIDLSLNKDTKNIPLLKNILNSNYNNKYEKYLISITNSNKKMFIRYGINSNSGKDQIDYFIADNEGNVLNDIQWDFDAVTEINIIPISLNNYYIRNGNFTTNSLNSKGETTYASTQKNMYFVRNIAINDSSNLTIQNITHTLSVDRLSGSYQGFLSIRRGANISIEDSSLYTRKFSIKGRSTYDLQATGAVNLLIKNVTSNDITDTNRWGITGTYYCKDVTLDNVYINRIDAHEGIYNLNILNSTIGVKGINMTGQGELNIINTTVNAPVMIPLREDYGSFWNGDINIIDSKFSYYNTNFLPRIISYTAYDGEAFNGFGYDLRFPNIYIDNLIIDYNGISTDNTYILYNTDATNSVINTSNLPYIDNHNMIINGVKIINDNDNKLSISKEKLIDYNRNYLVSDVNFKYENSDGKVLNRDFFTRDKINMNGDLYFTISPVKDVKNTIKIFKNDKLIYESEVLNDIDKLFNENGNYKIELTSETLDYGYTGYKMFEFIIQDKNPNIDEPIIDVNIVDIENTLKNKHLFIFLIILLIIISIGGFVLIMKYLYDKKRKC